VSLSFEGGNLLIEKSASCFDVVNIMSVTQSTFATEFLCRLDAVGFEGFGFQVFGRSSHDGSWELGVGSSLIFSQSATEVAASDAKSAYAD
jgi:hypothetical protein